VRVDGREICVVNVDGRLYAFRTVCPHQGGPLCKGTISGTMLPAAPHEYVYGLESRIVRCPWHGWEFDLADGTALFDPRVRVRTYPVTADDGLVVLST